VTPVVSDVPAAGRAAVDAQPVDRLTPQGTPVSNALKIPTSGKHAQMYRDVLDAIDSVHGDGVLPEIPVNTNNKLSAMGLYRFKGGAPINITMRGSGKGIEQVMAHEVGHFIDHQAIGTAGKFASNETGPSHILFGWARSVNESNAVKTLKAKRSSPSDFLVEIGSDGGVKWGATPRTKHLDYLLSDMELFARSYSQYIATRSRNPNMLRAMANDLKDAMYGEKQWSDEDFLPIAAAFDELFRGLGWLK